jgi:hypothetical protein
MRDKNKAILELVEFLESIKEDKVKFICKSCLSKSGYWVPPDFNYHDTAFCEGGCGELTEVSVPSINVKVNELELREVTNIRRLIWNPRLSIIRNERLKSFMTQQETV